MSDKAGIEKRCYFERAGEIRQAFNSISHANLVVVEPLVRFCPPENEYCLYVKDDELLYYDDDHLSMDGAHLLL